MTLVTLQQAKKLKELGYDRHTQRSYQLVPASVCNDSEQYGDAKFVTLCESSCKTRFELTPAPSTHEALEWFREVKGIECEVCLRLCFMGDTGEAVFGGYEYIIFDHNTNKTVSSTIYHKRSEAESALLDEVMKYVENVNC